jgi:hypothetical protein
MDTTILMARYDLQGHRLVFKGRMNGFQNIQSRKVKQKKFYCI